MNAVSSQENIGAPVDMSLSTEKTYVYFVTSQGHRLIEVGEVVEIIPMVLIDTSQQGSGNPGFAGLINYRGRIIPVFDVSAKESCCQPGVDQFLIVTATARNSIAIIATEVTQLVPISDTDISLINPAHGDHFRVAKVGDNMVRIVKTDEFVQVAT